MMGLPAGVEKKAEMDWGVERSRQVSKPQNSWGISGALFPARNHSNANPGYGRGGGGTVTR